MSFVAWYARRSSITTYRSRIMNSQCTSPQIAKKFEKVCKPGTLKSFSLQIKHVDEVSSFIKKIQSAHNSANISKLTFK